MKAPENVTACVVDYGNFLCLAEKLGETYRKVYYYSPHETEYREVARCVLGEGIPTIERCNEPLDLIGKVDLWVFPDIGFTGLQRHLVTQGAAVWGSRDVTNIELERSTFLKVLNEVGLPVAPSTVVNGLGSLTTLLKKAHDKWVKVDCYRENMETWHHIDYEHSLPMLRHLASTFGGASESITFVVQDPIPNAQECGYDGFCIDGRFPRVSFQGYEKKNELYLGSALPAREHPQAVQMVNAAMAPFLKAQRYRNFFATEIRDEYFIDPTPRMAGQSQEHLLETCTNLAEVIWAGANGELVEPEFSAKFAASATLHYKEVPGENWKALTIPQGIQRWFKLANHCRVGETYHFPPGRNDEVGVVIGIGNSVEKAIGAVQTHLEAVKDEPIEANLKEFADLLADIEKAQAAGDKFSDKPLPSAEVVLK